MRRRHRVWTECRSHDSRHDDDCIRLPAAHLILAGRGGPGSPCITSTGHTHVSTLSSQRHWHTHTHGDKREVGKISLLNIVSMHHKGWHSHWAGFSQRLQYQLPYACCAHSLARWPSIERQIRVMPFRSFTSVLVPYLSDAHGPSARRQ